VRVFCIDEVETSLVRLAGGGRGSLGSSSLSSDIMFDFLAGSGWRTGAGAGCCGGALCWGGGGGAEYIS